MTRGRSGLDVVGVGALNLDCLVDLAQVAAREGTDTAALRSWVAAACAGTRLDWGAEGFVDEPTVQAVLDRFGGAALAWQPGGSAFNTVHALACMGLGLRLGYVGVAGRSPVDGPSGPALLDQLGVDRRFVHRDRRLGGVCVSLVEDGERTMLTHTGANDGLGGFTERCRGPLTAYLAGARVVHVTSFADEEAPPRLAALLGEVKARAPRVLVAVDPGHAWSTSSTPGVERLLATADLLLLTARELAAVAGHAGSDAELARDLRARLGSQPTLLVKRADSVTVLGRAAATLRFVRRPLPARLVRDPTGAGDVLAAGVLAALARDPTALTNGIALGMRLARRKLRHVGAAGHHGFARLTRRCLGPAGQPR
ncbi:MAG TPA: carbohydrate kinase family protein [Actinomycetota bacterium]|nr:carbohydrate kinase family protein [Actinomycetota bacterium]